MLQLLRQNHAFNKLDLSRCFLSEKQFVSLMQALAWNSRVEEVSSDAMLSMRREEKPPAISGIDALIVVTRSAMSPSANA